MRSCERCLYWESTSREYFGTCRRYPRDYRDTIETMNIDWCGEFKSYEEQDGQGAQEIGDTSV